MTLLIIINLIATIITAYWLTRQINHQRQVIEDQSRKLNELKVFNDIAEKYLDPNSVLKLLENEKKILHQDTEIQRREIFRKTAEQTRAELMKMYEKDVVPKMELINKEFSMFVIKYFTSFDYKDKTERNAEIRLNLPNGADRLIEYLDTFFPNPSNIKENK